ncbi:MAG TPA: hypothetical protein EYP69_06400, partial [Bacteroidales bacterium]|nr:hypothetical protein [Bacteroidales bacterium]
MKIKQLYLFLLFFVSLAVHISLAQDLKNNHSRFNESNGLIKGKVLDNQTKQAVEYANITLFKYRDSSLYAGTITNAEGIFTFEHLHYGRYYLKIDFIGYKSKIISNIKVTPKTSTVFLDHIYYEPSIHKLDEVTISDNKALVEYKLEKKVINVEQDLSSIGGNAIDVLKNVPSVQVDMDDNVSIRGSSNITILIDGKRSAFSNSEDVLQQIPVSSIASIELITNPSAKFDPDGLAGIINIILKKNKKRGVNLTLSANGGTSQRYGGSVDFNIRIAKWNFFTSYNIRNNMRKFTGSTNQTNYFDNDSTVYLTQLGNKKRIRFSQSIRNGIDFYPNENSTISLSSAIRFGNYLSDGLTNYSEKDTDNISLSYFDIYNKDTANTYSLEISLTWEKIFDNPEQKLSANINYSTRKEYKEGWLDNYFSIYDMLPSDSVYFQQNTTNGFHNLSFAQVDYTHPFNEFSKLEMGIKSSIDNYDDDYVFMNLVAGKWEDDTNTTNHFIYKEKIYAVYSIFSSRIFGLDYLAGVRLEQVYRNSEQKTSNEDFEDSYFNYFPSLHISKKINKKNQVQISYSRRI